MAEPEPAWLERLVNHAEKNPILVVRFGEDDWETLSQSRRGTNQFTIARRHSLLEGVAKSTVCLISGKTEGGEELRLGLVSSRGAVATLDSRIKVSRTVRVEPSSLSQIPSLFTERRYSRNIEARFRETVEIMRLTPKVSGRLMTALASLEVNHGPMRTISESLSQPRRFETASELQEDAVHTALSAFGLSDGESASSLELVPDRETALARIPVLEDAVIEHDAREIPGFNLMGSDLTGRAVFEKASDRLEVYTANKRPLEQAFGVDLIYLNLTKKNIVMLQYKMLEPSGDDWIYRPDSKLAQEISRMRRFDNDHAPVGLDYRIHPGVFYLKFVKRDGAIRGGGIIMTLDHFEALRHAASARGPKGGLRVSFESLSGRYMRQSPFLDLIRSGYIGAYAEDTQHLRTLISQILRGNKAVVAAIQSAKDNAANGHDLDGLLGDIDFDELLEGNT